MAAHARASPPTRALCLLDSGLDDIKVPSLQPLPLIKTPSIVFLRANKTPSATVTKSPLDQHVGDLPIPVLEPQRVGSHSCATSTASVGFPWLTRRVHVKKQPFDNMNTPAPVPWDGQIRWALRGCSVFDNLDDEIDALLYRPNLITQEPPADLWVFQYGLRYLPAKHERDVYRAITIENLPSDVTMKQVLPLIYGEIYSAHLLDTVPITGYSTAIVTFVSQTDTLSFLKSSGGELMVGAAQAKVTLVATPTYPMTATMTRLVQDEGYTRCVCVSGLRESLQQEVHRVLRKSPHTNYVERIEDGEVVGDVNIWFHSIKVAIAAHGLLKSHPSFAGCKFRFLEGLRPTARPGIGNWD
ncbi:hypothetical protein BO94DRAFT_507774 [Aspergillus sclerotioniger CBS 115572]|uniref:Uncharacterized protein n=1 Tax=Aspergillus sclerotioniger CBS 115572 TaxID=1450535 RepID=A0A317X9S9_9EURO|nr:hypothetical protein BO94DRAFT_507774 [Aspergillus sclerotioniger CBS 115572]PWY94961.1 hypothetical protein BO94DRAFT_507774 [Aspergillus sclerotioniger CBS 115572]